MTLTDLLERERRGVRRLLTAGGVLSMAGGVALILAVGALLLDGARWLALPRPVPYALWALVAGLLALGRRVARRRMDRDATVAGVAREVERERAFRDGSLRGALEVANRGALGRLGAQAAAERLSGITGSTLAPGFRRRARRRAWAGTAAALAGAAVLILGATFATDGWAALVHPLRAWRGTLLDGVQLQSVPNAVLRGERVTVAVRAPGRREVTIAQRTTGNTWRATRVAVRNGAAALPLDPAEADFTLYATDGRAVSDTAVIRVVERPFIGDVTVRAIFPGYLDRREETIPLGEPARIPQGTVLVFEGQSSTELREVSLAREGSTVPMTASGRHFAGRLTASGSGRYEWKAVGRSGPIADVPPPLDLEVLPDSAPRVEILAPGGDTTVAAGDTVGISVLATDDHGIGSVDLRSWIVTAQGATRPWTGRSVSAENQAQWAGETALATGALAPGDALHVVVAATDRSPWRLKGESRELVLRLPTLSEQREAAREAADSTAARAASTAIAQRQLEQRTTDASRKRDREAEIANAKSGQNTMSYEAAQQAKQYAKEQRDLTERMQQLQGAAKELEEQLRKAGALDSALQAQLQEAQRLLSEALTPELQAQLRKLEQASQKLSGEEARKALSDLADQQRKLREQLEKSVEMLKRAALEGSMETLKDEAQELARKERQLADSLSRADNQQSKSTTQQEAKRLAERARDLSDDVKDLQQRLKQEKAESGAERVAEAQRRTQESVQQMEAAAQQQGEKSGTPQQKQGEQRAQGQQGQQGTPQQQGASSGSQQQQQQTGASGSQQGQQGQQRQQAQGQSGEKGGDPKAAEAAARQAAQAMEEAANQLGKAREQQVGEWKQELTTELDRSIQEMIQLAREQDALEQKARQGTAPQDLRAEQSTLQQGVEKSSQRLEEAGQKSSLLSQRSLRMVSDARRRVEDATRTTQQASTSGQVASAMREASESLNQAAASLVRDRERAQNANSASGFAEMLQQLQQMAQQQSNLNSAAQELVPRPGTQLDARGQQTSRQLGRQQRDVASKLEDVGDRDESGRAAELAKEARQIAQALEAAQLDQAVLERQQRLFRKMLDAGRMLEEEEREDTGKREAKAWTGTDVFTPSTTSASGRAASRFQPPTWNDLRGLSPEERRLVLEYFKKINGDRP
jgi:hypothetical protein